MTQELQDSLARALEDAQESGDAKRIDRAHANILLALMDCQRKTATRVKELHESQKKAKYRYEGAAWLWRIIGVAAASGGGAVILKFAEAWTK